MGRGERGEVSTGPIGRPEVGGLRVLDVALQEEDVPQVDLDLGGPLVRRQRRRVPPLRAREIAAPLEVAPQRSRERGRRRRLLPPGGEEPRVRVRDGPVLELVDGLAERPGPGSGPRAHRREPGRRDQDEQRAGAEQALGRGEVEPDHRDRQADRRRRPEAERERRTEEHQREEGALDRRGPPQQRQVVEVVEEEAHPSQEDERSGHGGRGEERRQRGRREVDQEGADRVGLAGHRAERRPDGRQDPADVAGGVDGARARDGEVGVGEVRGKPRRQLGVLDRLRRVVRGERPPRLAHERSGHRDEVLDGQLALGADERLLCRLRPSRILLAQGGPARRPGLAELRPGRADRHHPPRELARRLRRWGRRRLVVDQPAAGLGLGRGRLRRLRRRRPGPRGLCAGGEPHAGRAARLDAARGLGARLVVRRDEPRLARVGLLLGRGLVSQHVRRCDLRRDHRGPQEDERKDEGEGQAVGHASWEC